MTNPNDNEERRAYWASKMEEAFSFMGHIHRYPVAECGEPVVSLVDAVAGAGVEVVFSERPHVQGLPRLYLLRAGLIDDLIRCAREMNERGWVRLLWECKGAQPPVDLVMRRVGALVAAAPKVGTHMSGSAIDILVLDRANGEEIDRGRPYLEMSELTPMDSPFISAQTRANRAAIGNTEQRW